MFLGDNIKLIVISIKLMGLSIRATIDMHSDDNFFCAKMILF